MTIKVSIEDFGKDHWSLLAYIETRCVDYKGILDKRRMRCNPDNHPHFDENKQGWLESWGTVIRDGSIIGCHDDWDCLSDLADMSLISIDGTIDSVQLTIKGFDVVNQIRRHKANGGTFSNFVLDTEKLSWYYVVK